MTYTVALATFILESMHSFCQILTSYHSLSLISVEKRSFVRQVSGRKKNEIEQLSQDILAHLSNSLS